MRKKIFVNGNIIIKRNFDYSELTCGVAAGDKSLYDQYIEGDLTIDEGYKDDSLLNWYYAKKGIVSYSVYGNAENSRHNIRNYYHEYLYAIYCIELFKEIDSPPGKSMVYMLSFINVIGAMESFLFRLFKHVVLSDKIYLRKFVETYPLMREKKLSLSEIIDRYENLPSEIGCIIDDINFHRLPNIKQMFKDVLDVNVDISNIISLIEIRHDLVHRNGYSKDNVKVDISGEQLNSLIKDMNSFIDSIISQIIKNPLIYPPLLLKV